MKTTLRLKLLAYTPNPDAVVAKGGKLCYYPGGIEELEEGLTEEKISKFVTMLAEMEHESPLEHAVFTFGIEGVSRSLTHQLVRHRLASYSQKSQRYVSEGSFEYVMPKDISDNEEAKKVFVKAMENAQEAYDKITEELLAEKIKTFYKGKKQTIDEEKAGLLQEIKIMGNQEVIQHCKKHFKRDYSRLEKLSIENARAVLPNACETKIIVTMNARILLHFFKKRCCSRAQEEIRDLATEMLKLVKTVAPNIFKYAGPACLHDVCPEGDMTCGRIKEVREQFGQM
ncbi:FAD-dependent thymidylate synthase [Clostridium formicaceticum]|jgi:thymidylate synthase (FAD)|uniref:Flavin-dependent thymidylate synthase n=1 Tax=Clostridium formicaceticum TaxID=1497 RepID=A0AAC9WI24_9CLOT|nr:FAD-dependent thymidylate synthase [Clostridium formicaceticum]AOY75124.1 FAD-dependent thymidylate synthase [Clostridium formicaceticum]ARE89548.1 Thymidylate synthase ThyX [Clostridium formicaceticum]